MTQASVAIRKANAADAVALADLSTQLGYPTEAAEILARLQRVQDEQIGEVFVAVGAGDHVVGWAHVVPRFVLEDSPFAELAGLVVDHAARGNGVGVALLRSAEEWASAQGFVRFRVRSNVIRERAHRFYLREGYVERKRQITFEKPLV